MTDLLPILKEADLSIAIACTNEAGDVITISIVPKIKEASNLRLSPIVITDRAENMTSDVILKAVYEGLLANYDTIKEVNYLAATLKRAKNQLQPK